MSRMTSTIEWPQVDFSPIVGDFDYLGAIREMREQLIQSLSIPQIMMNVFKDESPVPDSLLIAMDAVRERGLDREGECEVWLLDWVVWPGDEQYLYRHLMKLLPVAKVEWTNMSGHPGRVFRDEAIRCLEEFSGPLGGRVIGVKKVEWHR